MPDRFLSRRHLALSIWTMQLVALAFCSPPSDVATAIGLQFSVGLTGAAAIYLFAKHNLLETAPTRNLLIGFFASLAIQQIWAAQLGGDQPPAIVSGLILVGSIPLLFSWAALHADDFMINKQSNSNIGDTKQAQAPLDPSSAEPSSRRVRVDNVAHSVPGPHTAAVAPYPADDFEQMSATQPSSNQENQPPLNITQWQRRSVFDGGEIIEGGARIAFARGQRETTLHVSFCPPFPLSPEVTTEDLDGNQLEIRVAALFPFGARLTIRRPPAELKFDSDTSPSQYRIAFVAIANRAKRAA